MNKRNVYLIQANSCFGNALFLPYSVGLLQAYAQTIPCIRDAYDFQGFLFTREPVREVVENMEEPDVVGFSSYIWNHEYNLALAAEVRRAFPHAHLVIGGPHVPESVDEMPPFNEVVHHEGEIAFAEILMARLEERAPKLKNLERTRDLELLPSPYLSGVFNEMLGDPNAQKIEWVMSQETHRGCPYSCTFCDWGSAVFQKVRRFSKDRIEAELEWAGKNKIELLYNCDANYGLFDTDLEFTKRMVETKRTYGFPKQFRAAYAKNSNARVFQIAKTLDDAEMCKGVTLSFQSLDENVLGLIKRKNMKMNSFKELIMQYTKAGIPTYTEIILGLPGETYDSFTFGIERLLEAGQHDSINIYPCMVLPNAEMANPKYREIHGIITIRVPDIATHSVPSEDPYPEYKDIVIATEKMPTGAWREAYTFGCFVQAFHSMGLLQTMAKLSADRIPYREFYKSLIIEAKRTRGPVNAAWEIVQTAIQRAYEGKCWDQVVDNCGPISWTPEEQIFLAMIKTDTYFRLLAFVADIWGIKPDIVLKQFESIRHPVEFPSMEDYARAVVWYGRKASKWRREP